MTDTVEFDIDEGVMRQAVGYLKMEPLAHTDPNDHEELTACVEKAAVICDVHKMKVSSPELLTQLALAVEQWTIDFAFEDWAMNIFINKYMSPEERIKELYRYRAFMDVGPEAIDFPLYCILRFNNSYVDEDYEPQDIHAAADLGLKIAQAYGITDLVNTYFCVEMLLVAGEDYMALPAYKPMQIFFQNNSLSATQKIDESYAWLTANLDSLQ